MTAVALPKTALFLPAFQKRWVQDRSRFKAGMMSRQVGKTFGSTLELVDSTVEREAGGGRERWVILSRGERQAKEAMREGVQRHLQAYGRAAEAMEVDWEGKCKALECTLPGGSTITALPANPDTARGFSANVLLDEFGFHLDSRAIWKALFPVISRPDLKLRVISTPNGKNNKFYELMTQGGAEAELRRTGHVTANRWSLHFADIYRAVREGVDRDIEELREGAGDVDLWNQEFELLWLDEASAWLSYELISTCEDMDAGNPDAYQGGPCFVGVDIATRKDLFVIWVWERIGNVFWCREVVAKQRITFAAQDELLDDVVRRYRVVKIHADQTGMGEKPVEDMKRRYGASRVHGVIFSAPAKQHLATVGKQVFEDRNCRIPQDNAVRSDFHKLKRVTGPTGVVRFLAESDEAGHADRAWAAFLGLDAANDVTGVLGADDYIQLPSRRPVGTSVRGQDDDDNRYADSRAMP